MVSKNNDLLSLNEQQQQLHQTHPNSSPVSCPRFSTTLASSFSSSLDRDMHPQHFLEEGTTHQHLSSGGGKCDITSCRLRPHCSLSSSTSTSSSSSSTTASFSPVSLMKLRGSPLSLFMEGSCALFFPFANSCSPTSLPPQQNVAELHTEKIQQEEKKKINGDTIAPPHHHFSSFTSSFADRSSSVVLLKETESVDHSKKKNKKGQCPSLHLKSFSPFAFTLTSPLYKSRMSRKFPTKPTAATTTPTNLHVDEDHSRCPTTSTTTLDSSFCSQRKMLTPIGELSPEQQRDPAARRVEEEDEDDEFLTPIASTTLLHAPATSPQQPSSPFLLNSKLYQRRVYRNKQLCNPIKEEVVVDDSPPPRSLHLTNSSAVNSTNTTQQIKWSSTFAFFSTNLPLPQNIEEDLNHCQKKTPSSSCSSAKRVSFRLPIDDKDVQKQEGEDDQNELTPLAQKLSNASFSSSMSSSTSTSTTSSSSPLRSSPTLLLPLHSSDQPRQQVGGLHALRRDRLGNFPLSEHRISFARTTRHTVSNENNNNSNNNSNNSVCNNSFCSVEKFNFDLSCNKLYQKRRVHRSTKKHED